MQLIKQIDCQNHCWWFEKDGRTLYTFRGIMKDRLEGCLIRELVAEKEIDGYSVVQEEGLYEIIVEFFVRI